MKSLIAYLKREPVRVRIYAIAGVVVTYLLSRGYVQATDSDFILSLLALILGTEGLRGVVSPANGSTKDSGSDSAPAETPSA